MKKIDKKLLHVLAVLFCLSSQSLLFAGEFGAARGIEAEKGAERTEKVKTLEEQKKEVEKKLKEKESEKEKLQRERLALITQRVGKPETVKEELTKQIEPKEKAIGQIEEDVRKLERDKEALEQKLAEQTKTLGKLLERPTKLTFTEKLRRFFENLFGPSMEKSEFVKFFDKLKPEEISNVFIDRYVKWQQAEKNVQQAQELNTYFQTKQLPEQAPISDVVLQKLQERAEQAKNEFEQTKAAAQKTLNTRLKANLAQITSEYDKLEMPGQIIGGERILWNPEERLPKFAQEVYAAQKQLSTEIPRLKKEVTTQFIQKKIVDPNNSLARKRARELEIEADFLSSNWYLKNKYELAKKLNQRLQMSGTLEQDRKLFNAASRAKIYPILGRTEVDLQKIENEGAQELANLVKSDYDQYLDKVKDELHDKLFQLAQETNEEAKRQGVALTPSKGER